MPSVHIDVGDGIASGYVDDLVFTEVGDTFFAVAKISADKLGANPWI